MFSSATSFFGARSAAAAPTAQLAEPLRQEKTLADLMRAAARKSRRLSSPKSTAPLRNVVLQNRMVKVVNDALANNDLSTTVSSLDAQKQKPTFKFSPMAAVFTPSLSTMIDTFTLPSVDSEW